MKTLTFWWVFGIMSLSSLFAQSISPGPIVYFQSGQQTFPENLESFVSNPQISKQLAGNRFYRYVQFYKTPTQEEYQKVERTGLKLLEYIPRNTYLVSFPRNYDLNQLRNLGIRSVVRPTYEHKMAKRLLTDSYPAWAVHDGQIDVNIKYVADLNYRDMETQLRNMGYPVLQHIEGAKMATVSLPLDNIYDVIDHSFFTYMEPIEEEGEPEDFNGRGLHRSNVLDSEYAAGRHYTGEGVNIMVRDDGDVGPHIDFEGRNVNFASPGGGTHGDGVAGVMGSAGNLDPTVKGAASGSMIYVLDYVSTFLDNTLSLHQTDSVMITNSSYSNGCNAGYTTTTQRVDEQIYDNPSLLHVFSAGNSNNQNCGYGAGNQWGNITGGHKMGKNVIATANLNDDGTLAGSSSRGPANDGRIKPDIAAHGAGQISTDPNNTYQVFGGTSAAAPSAAGVIAQLYQAYKEMNGNAFPESPLMKACVLNTATDLGNVGPDFRFGWGHINGYQAIKILENNTYFDSTISQSGTNTHTITIPAGLQEARVMVYWLDPEGSTSASLALVNNLDMKLTDGSGTDFFPWILDHTPNATTLNTPATTGVDSINNVEQVALTSPAAGTYTLTVSGTDVPQGPQKYYVVYSFFDDGIEVTYPQGGESMDEGFDEYIQWDAYGNSGSFTVEYTTNGGSTWSTLTTVPASERLVQWNLPNIITGEARVRVTRGAVSGESIEDFSIMPVPTNLQIAQVCPTTTLLTWNGVSGADAYDVFLLGDKYMDSVGSTTSTSFNIPNTDPNVVQWFSVRAKTTAGAIGRRAFAVSSPGSGLIACSQVNDIAAQTISTNGSNLFSFCASDTLPIEVNLINLGSASQFDIPVFYQFGTNPPVMEMYNDTLNPGGSATYIFSAPLIGTGFTGTAELKVGSSLGTDTFLANDTLSTTISAGAGLPLVEDFESGNFPPEGWRLENPDGEITWTANNVTGSSGTPTTAAYLNNFSYNAAGQEDRLVSIALDLTTGISPTLTFDVAYVRYSATFTDELQVRLSQDCGVNFPTTLYAKADLVLATAGSSTSSWVPTSAAHWRNETIDLTPYVGGKVVLQFVNITGFGNSLFIDNINITDVLAPPIAAFNTSALQLCETETVTFTSTSTAAATYDWNFGVGASPATANTAGPHVVTYSTAGSSTASLIVGNTMGNDTANEVLAIDPLATADFTYANSNAWTYDFTNTSLNWNTVSWDFGDGGVSTDPDPTHQYGLDGTYQVTLIATNPCGMDTLSQMVTVSGVTAPTPDFVVSEEKICVGDTVIFTDASTGAAISHSWDFGVDAMPGTDSTAGPHAVVYTSGGIKNITLTTSNLTGDNSKTITIEVHESPDAQFSSQLTGNQTFEFEPAASAQLGTTFSWDFGDGSTSMDAIPTHTYTANNSYTVVLIANNSCGADTTTETIEINNVGIVDGLEGARIAVFPNPNKGIFEIKLSGEQGMNYSFELLDVRGKSVSQFNLPFAGGELTHKVNVQDVARGVYLLKIVAGTQTATTRILIE